MEKTKEYDVVTNDANNTFEVKVLFQKGHLDDCKVKTFKDGILAKAHAKWAMFEAWDSDKVESVQINQVLWRTIRSK